jgi:hypothetical protein
MFLGLERCLSSMQSNQHHPGSARNLNHRTSAQARSRMKYFYTAVVSLGSTESAVKFQAPTRVGEKLHYNLSMQEPVIHP